MQTIELKKNLNLSILPENAQQEVIDFYQFIVEKYVKKQNECVFADTIQNTNIQDLKGVFSQYADTSKIALEKSAWKQHLVNKHSHD